MIPFIFFPEIHLFPSAVAWRGKLCDEFNGTELEAILRNREANGTPTCVTIPLRFYYEMIIFEGESVWPVQGFSELDASVSSEEDE